MRIKILFQISSELLFFSIFHFEFVFERTFFHEFIYHSMVLVKIIEK